MVAPGIVLLLLRTSCCIAAESAMKCHTTDEAIVCEIPLDLVKAGGSFALEGCDDEYCVRATVAKNVPPPMESYSETVEDSDSSTIHVGSLVYEEPYTQYGTDVAAILENRPRIRSDTTDVEKDFVLASFYAQLGPAHRTRAQGHGDTVDWEGKDGLACIESLSQAIQHFERAEPYLSDISSHRTPISAYANPDDTRIAIANAHSYLADASQVEKKTKPVAQDHLRIAIRIYREVLDHPIDPPLPTDIYGDVELNLAESLTRMGIWLMDNINEAILDQEHGQIQIDLSKSSSSFSTQSIGESAGDWSHLMKSVEEADQKFAEAVLLFRKQAEATSTEDSDYSYLHIQLATTLQHHGSATMYLADLDKTIALWEEALAIYRKMYHLLTAESHDHYDVKMGMSELMYSLSEVLLQNGSYAKSQQYYEDSMDWYLEHGITQPHVQNTMLEEDETLNLYETTLEQYHNMLNGVGPGIQIPDDGGMLYEPDELFEADIHATLGAIRLARDEAVLAMDHFQAAVTLYEGYNADDAAIADVKINMALALLRLEEYEESARVHEEALDIYRKTIGEGKNPFIEGLPFDLGAAQGDEESSSNQDGKDDQKKPAVHERLINLDAYRAGLINMTAAMDEL
jgi:tetratricopeptide (TPR) repeat protein